MQSEGKLFKYLEMGVLAVLLEKHENVSSLQLGMEEYNSCTKKKRKSLLDQLKIRKQHSTCTVYSVLFVISNYLYLLQLKTVYEKCFKSLPCQHYISFESESGF